MGFMDFLKKDGGAKPKDDLQFGPPPVAPQTNMSGSPDDLNLGPAPTDLTPSHEEFMPPGPEQANSMMLPDTTPGVLPDDFDAPPVPPEPFKEQPNVPPEQQLAPEVDQELQTPAEDPHALPAFDDQAPAANPFEQEAAAPPEQVNWSSEAQKDDLDLPDLPDLPEEKPSEDEKPSIEDKIEQPPLPKLDGGPEIEPPQHEKKDTEPARIYVESHDFFALIQDIKNMKRGIREEDDVIKTWIDNDQTLEKKSDIFFGHVNTIQEQLINIDSELFER